MINFCTLTVWEDQSRIASHQSRTMDAPSLHGQKSTPAPKSLGTAKAYFFCQIGSKFQMYLIYAFIRSLQSVTSVMHNQGCNTADDA